MLCGPPAIHSHPSTSPYPIHTLPTALYPFHGLWLRSESLCMLEEWGSILACPNYTTGCSDYITGHPNFNTHTMYMLSQSLKQTVNRIQVCISWRQQVSDKMPAQCSYPCCCYGKRECGQWNAVTYGIKGSLKVNVTDTQTGRLDYMSPTCNSTCKHMYSYEV